MIKKPILTTIVLAFLTFSVYQSFASIESDNTELRLVNNNLLASERSLREKENSYKLEIEKLKYLIDNKDASIKDKDTQIDKIVLIKLELEAEKLRNETLKEENESLREQIKDISSLVTSEDKPDSANVTKITNIDIEAVNKKFKGGALANKGALMVEIAERHNISPYFFVALISLESGYGKSKLAKSQFNFGGIKGSKNKYRSFASPEEGLEYIASLLERRYISKGLVSVNKIGAVYAPSYDNNHNWPGKIKTLMLAYYNASKS